MNCKDFHIEVEAGLRDTRLSVSAEEHAAGCPPCHEFNQKHVEFREWMAVCQTITAPKDFQFGVQRKIASSSSSHSHDWIWRGLRYIVPSSAAVAVLVLAISYTFNNQNVQTSPTSTSAAMANSDAGNSLAAKETNPAPENNSGTITGNVTEEQPKPENEKLAVNPANKQENNSRAVTPGGGTLDSKGGGSVTQGVANSAPSKLPKGLYIPENERANRSTTLLALSDLGVVSSVDLKVLRLKSGSAAARSDLKVGDQIESVNGNILTVNRDGLILQITLK
jgi:hypothetical protein